MLKHLLLELFICLFAIFNDASKLGYLHLHLLGFFLNDFEAFCQSCIHICLVFDFVRFDLMLHIIKLRVDLKLRLFQPFVQFQTIDLLFCETLVDERFTLPRVDVLADHCVTNHVKHFLERQWDVIPFAVLE